MAAKTNQEVLIDHLWVAGNTVDEISAIICVHAGDVESYLKKEGRI